MAATQSQNKYHGATPAANAEISEQILVGRTWGLVGVTFTMTQGITQTPQPILIIDDGQEVLFSALGCGAAQAASTTCRYSFFVGFTTQATILGATTACFSFAPLPQGLILKPGYRIRTSTLGIGANSQYSAPTFLIVDYGDAASPLFPVSTV